MLELKWLEYLLINIRAVIALMGVAVISLGSLKAFYNFIFNKGITETVQSNHIRLRLGYLILLGLEFIIGADIIESIIKPDYYSLGLLAILVIVRTVLSYFLNKELESITGNSNIG